MNKLLVVAICLFAAVSVANAQAVNITKSVEPKEVLVGGEVLVTVVVNTNASLKLNLVDKVPRAFELVSLDPRIACSHEVEELTGNRVLRCEIAPNLSERMVYAIKANEGGVYNLPEVLAVPEKGAEFRSRSTAKVTVGIPELLPTTPPPQTLPPPKEEFSLTAVLSKAYGFIRNAVVAIFPEPVRLLLLSIILFVAIVLFLIVAFHVFLHKDWF